MIGRRFERLTVLEQVDKLKHLKTRGKYYLCKCDCTNTLIVYGKSLRTGNTKSCGCLFIESHKGNDLSGSKFGKLTVIKEVEKPEDEVKMESYWSCICDCGNKDIVVGRTKIITGNVKSCGCMKSKRRNANKFSFNHDYVTVEDCKGREFIVDIESYNKILEFDRYWYIHINTSASKDERYVVCKYKNKIIKLHNFLMNPSDGMLVDHINGNTLDNRMSNLRMATQQQNAMNKAIAINNTSGVKGVSRVKRNNKWVARISFEGKRIVLGTFDTFEEAVKARRDAEELYYGEFNRSGD